MLRLLVVLLAFSLLMPACTHRVPPVSASAVTPADSTWDGVLACAQNVLRAAGFDVRVGPRALSAERRGSPIGSDPPTQQVDRVIVTRSTEVQGAGSTVFDVNFSPPTYAPVHGRIVARSFVLHGTSPSQGGSYLTDSATSSDALAAASAVRRECSH